MGNSTTIEAFDRESWQEAMDHYSGLQSMGSSADQLAEPRNYIMGLGGKRIRAMLCSMAYHLYHGEFEPSIELSYALELFHNFTLLHDDIMDEAELRRGKSCAHILFGNNRALLSGDAMLIEVYKRLLSIDIPEKLRFLERFSEIAMQVCEGQSKDMSFEQKEEVSLSEYLYMIELKTAVLLGFSLQAGAWLGKASSRDAMHLYNFGKNIGISFQLQDDYLDVYGETDRFGKKNAGDIIQGKKTYLYLKAIELLNAEQRKEFIGLYKQQSAPEQKIRQVKSVFDELHLNVYCNEAKEAYLQLAQSHLKELNVGASKTREMISFAQRLMNREV